MKTRPLRLALTGQRFGDWFVLGFSHKNKRGEIYWQCRDEVSGERRAVKARSLTSGRSQSSGHRHKQAVTTHGMTGTPTFRTWESMKQRCLNPNAPDYGRYGGAGIRVHEPWAHSFETFFADMGLRPSDTTLDRIDTFGDYEPSNCRWATGKMQQRNRREMRTMFYRGEALTFAEWAERSGIPSKVLIWRFDKGWPAERALTSPVRSKRR